MIIDKIKNSELFENLHPKFAKAFKYLKVTDFSLLEDGKYKIDGEDVFAIVQEYNTKDQNTAKLESHHKYIDIQYMHSGNELIGYSTLGSQVVISDNIEKDLVFYDGDASFVKLDPEMFAIFFLHDLHMPGIKVMNSGKVKKIVVKVKV